MKKIIDGIRYDTEKATKVAKYNNNLGDGDFNYLREYLYHTRNNRWFLHGYGGAFTKYSVSVGSDGRGGGENIIPINDSEALEWLQNNDEIDVIELYFSGSIIEA